MAKATEEANKELVREYLEVLNDQQVDRIPDFFADDFTVDLMQVDEGESEEGGVDDIVEGVKDAIEAFPDATNHLKEMAAEGDWVLYRVEVEGTHDGEWRGIEPTGEEVWWQLHGSIRIEDGEFVETHGTASNLHRLAQLGVDLPFESED